jgi:heme-degrading monooxygenase HmoA
MYTASFIWEPGIYDQEFNALNAEIEALVATIPGYLGVEVWQTEDGKRHIATYYWDNMESLKILATHPQHLEAKRKYAQWYKGYQVVLAQVFKSYGDGNMTHITADLKPAVVTSSNTDL